MVGSEVEKEGRIFSDEARSSGEMVVSSVRGRLAWGWRGEQAREPGGLSCKGGAGAGKGDGILGEAQGGEGDWCGIGKACELASLKTWQAREGHELAREISIKLERQVSSLA
ncbi:unnamed protein product [Dovyalis caffra]|uniref:Uncharacterized protein n=1 Tax=Dovyalis caffra TaxID=77055 RepID=A0AAV1SE90_9ROSI|nr:unnamed protein product [Dovyalis caffra]